MMGPQESQADLDAWAKKQGFQSYAQMKAFMARRSESLQNSNTTQRVAPAAPPPPRPAEQQQGEGVFGYIMRKLAGG